MKKLAILILITGTIVEISAQQPKTFRYREFTFPDDSTGKLATNIHPSYFSIDQAKFSHRLANGDRVYLLRRDHMPCIVPDMSQYNYSMPVKKGKTNNTMPNAAPPEQIILKEKAL